MSVKSITIYIGEKLNVKIQRMREFLNILTILNYVYETRFQV